MLLTRNAAVAALFALLGGACLPGACGGGDASSPPGSAGAGAGGGGAGTAGAGGTPSAGAAGAGASGAAGQAAGAAGATTAGWASAGTVVSCTIERLTNPGDVRVLDWAPCGDGCQAATLRVGPLGASSKSTRLLSAGTRVTEQADGPRLLLMAQINQFLVTAADGTLLDAYRPKGTGCAAHAGSTWADRHALLFYHDKGTSALEFGVLIGAPGVAPNLFPLNYPIGDGPQWMALGPARLGFDWGAPGAVSVSVVDGTSFTNFAPATAKGPVFLVEGPAATPDGFLVREARQTTETLAFSDGVMATQPWGSAPDAYDGSVVFADTHVAWRRGFNKKDINVYESVELWAAEYTPNPAQVKPYKVGAVESTAAFVYYPAMAGAYGRAALILGNNQAPNVVVWDVAKKVKLLDMPLPVQGKEGAGGLLGLTKKDVWVIVGAGLDSRILRLALPG